MQYKSWGRLFWRGTHCIPVLEFCGQEMGAKQVQVYFTKMTGIPSRVNVKNTKLIIQYELYILFYSIVHFPWKWRIYTENIRVFWFIMCKDRPGLIARIHTPQIVVSVILVTWVPDPVWIKPKPYPGGNILDF